MRHPLSIVIAVLLIVNLLFAIAASILLGRQRATPRTEVLQLCSHPVVGWQNAPGIFGLWSIQVATI